MKKKIIFAIIAVVVVGAFLFYGGMQYGKVGIQTQPKSQFLRGEGMMGGGTTNGSFRGGVGRGSAGMISGEILSKDATSITVKLSDGGSKNIFFASSTKVLKTAEGTMNDILVGTQVFGQGTVNPDGSINAQSIQIRNNQR